MTDNQRKWLQELQGKGVMFEYFSSRGIWTSRDYINFNNCQIERCRLEAQSIPDIPDWREVCWDMQSKGIEIEYRMQNNVWRSGKGRSWVFNEDIHTYRIPAQLIQEWREDMTKAQPEAKQEKPEVPHKDLQIQWHEDCIHSLKTGEPMREWEYLDSILGRWSNLSANPRFANEVEYRRKPRTVTYWHCVVTIMDKSGQSQYKTIADAGDRRNVEDIIQEYKYAGEFINYTPITETTVDIHDQD